MVKRLLLTAYDAIATKVSCCVVGCGCSVVIITAGGTLTGAAGYGAYQVLS